MPTSQQQTVLEKLIAPLTSAQFFADYWPEQVYTSHGDLARLPGMFSSPILKSIESLSEHYRGRVLFTRGRKSSFMAPAENGCPKTLFNMGLTVYLDNIQHCLPKSPQLLQALEYCFGIPPGTARIAAFASPPGDGAACHYDTEDVISIQLTGTKTFHVAPVEEIRYPIGMQYSPGSSPYTDLYPQANGCFPEWENADFESIDMRPGSVLFMPRGTWHRTEADEPSLSITIALRPQSAAEIILENMRWLLLQDADWRKPLYGAYGDSPLKKSAMAAADALLQRLPKQIEPLSVRSLELALMPEDLRLNHIDEHSRFVSLPNASLRVSKKQTNGTHKTSVLVADDADGDRVTAEMEVHPESLQLLEWLGSRRAPFGIGDMHQAFPAVPETQQLDILHSCANAELIRMLWYPTAGA